MGLIELYTSHWGSKELPHLDATMVAISRGKPRWKLPFRYRVLSELAPSREIFGLPSDEFDEAYRQQLDELGPERVLTDLTRIAGESGNKPLVLLCWERPGEPCHRRLLAGWLEERTAVELPELVAGTLSETTPPDQRTLF